MRRGEALLQGTSKWFIETYATQTLQEHQKEQIFHSRSSICVNDRTIVAHSQICTQTHKQRVCILKQLILQTNLQLLHCLHIEKALKKHNKSFHAFLWIIIISIHDYTNGCLELQLNYLTVATHYCWPIPFNTFVNSQMSFLFLFPIQQVIN